MRMVTLIIPLILGSAHFSHAGHKQENQEENTAKSFALTDEYISKADVFDLFFRTLYHNDSLACIYERQIAASKTANAFVKMLCGGQVFEFRVSSKHPSDGPTLEFGMMENGHGIFSDLVDSFLISILIEAGFEESIHQKNLYIKK